MTHRKMSARLRFALPVLLTLVVLGGPLAAAGTSLPAAPGVASADQTEGTPTSTVPEGTTSINIQLEADGDANWTITTRLPADDETDREAFRELATRYENGQREAPWQDKVEAANGAAESATDRSMNVTDVRRTSNVRNTTLSLHFTWTNFSREADGQYVADDVFNTTRGTWLPELAEDQILTVELPPSATLQDAPTGIQGGRFRWKGPQQFDPGYMHIAYTVDESETTTTANGPTTPMGSNDLLWGGFFVLGIGIVAVGAYVLSRRRDGLSPATTDDDGPDSPSASATSGPSRSVDSQTATAGTVEPSGAADEEMDAELLSDEERVERLLEVNGGRMKQANIVKETGWSNAKVSQLLSAMEDDGHIDKLRIGRENLISFPDEDVTDVNRD